MKYIAEAAVFRRFMHLVTAALQQKFRVLYADLSDVLVYSLAGLLFKNLAKIIRVQMNLGGKFFYRKFFRVMPGNITDDSVDTVIARRRIYVVYNDFRQAVQNQHEQSPALHKITAMLFVPAYR
jgi:hypothetical protein